MSDRPTRARAYYAKWCVSRFYPARGYLVGVSAVWFFSFLAYTASIGGGTDHAPTSTYLRVATLFSIIAVFFVFMLRLALVCSGWIIAHQAAVLINRKMPDHAKRLLLSRYWAVHPKVINALVFRQLYSSLFGLASNEIILHPSLKMDDSSSRLAIEREGGVIIIARMARRSIGLATVLYLISMVAMIVNLPFL